jgi:predicted TIM-barrel enzyme
MERTAQETDEIIKDIKSKVDLLTSIDKRFSIKFIKQSIKEEPKETIEKNEELHRNNLVKFHF